MTAANIVINCPPAVLFLDTPEAIAIAEYFTQRSKHTLTKRYPKRGLKIHNIPGESEIETNRQYGNRPYIVYQEYLRFLETISTAEMEDDNS